MDALGIAYMIAGSQASIYYGEPRFTQDIDVVADVNASHVQGLLASFPADEYYTARRRSGRPSEPEDSSTSFIPLPASRSMSW